MDKFLKMSYLIDLYSSLLTEKQIDVLTMYYEDDMSLAEIAGILKISRQGVHDILKRGEKIIENYDSKLHLLDKYENNIKAVDNLIKMSDNELIATELEKLKENL